MTNRGVAGTLAAAVVLGFVFAPAETAARSATISVSHHGGFHRSSTAFMHRSTRPTPAPVRHVSFASPNGTMVRVHNSSAPSPQHHRRVFGFGLPLTWAGSAMFYGRYYDPSDVVGAFEVPPEGEAPNGADPMLAQGAAIGPDRGGCRSEDVRVTSPSGSERTVTVTRC